MGHIRQLTGAFVLAMGLQGPAHADAPLAITADPDADRHFEIYKQLRSDDAPEAPLLVANCQTDGKWQHVPDDDNSAMKELGRSMCVNNIPFEMLSKENGDRAKTFNQLGLAYDYLRQKVQLGKPVESGEIPMVPTIWVARRPNASDSGETVYTFYMDKKLDGQMVVPARQTAYKP